MDTFNYRIVRTNDPVRFAIHEAYYGADGELEAIGSHPVSPKRNTRKELRMAIAEVFTATHGRVIDGDKI